MEHASWSSSTLEMHVEVRSFEPHAAPGASHQSELGHREVLDGPEVAHIETRALPGREARRGERARHSIAPSARGAEPGIVVPLRIAFRHRASDDACIEVRIELAVRLRDGLPDLDAILGAKGAQTVLHRARATAVVAPIHAELDVTDHDGEHAVIELEVIPQSDEHLGPLLARDPRKAVVERRHRPLGVAADVLVKSVLGDRAHSERVQAWVEGCRHHHPSLFLAYSARNLSYLFRKCRLAWCAWRLNSIVARAEPCPTSSSLWERFREQARRSPLASAVRWPGGLFSYAELDTKPRGFAAALDAAGVAAGRVVSLRGSIDGFFVAALLGALSRGAVACIAENEPILAELGAFDITSIPELPGDDAREALSRASVAPSAPATVALTGGSSGAPRAVFVRHAAIARFIDWARDAYGVGPGDRVRRFCRHRSMARWGSYCCLSCAERRFACRAPWIAKRRMRSSRRGSEVQASPSCTPWRVSRVRGSAHLPEILPRTLRRILRRRRRWLRAFDWCC